MEPLERAIHSALKDCLKIQKRENVLIVSDTAHHSLGYKFYQIAKANTPSAYFFVFPENNHFHAEKDKLLATHLTHSDAAVLITDKSLSHTKARRRACRSGTRIVSLPQVSTESLIRCLSGNYKSIQFKTRKLADILTIGRNVKLTTPAGTSLTFSISRMKGFAETGMIHKPGQFANLPFGESCVAPVAGSAQGHIVIDYSFYGVGQLKTPIKIKVKDGYAARITGGEEVETVRHMLRPFGRDSRNIAEMGIGTNPMAKLTGITVEDEKVLGTIHVALGDNLSFGGKVSAGIHLDGVMLSPTLVIDEKVIIEDGELQI